MCGIIGYVGSREAKPLLLAGLERLEYRGYDSAGLGLLEEDGLAFVRAVDQVTQAAHELLDSLVTNAPPRDREVEAAKARARAADRFRSSDATRAP